MLEPASERTAVYFIGRSHAELSVYLSLDTSEPAANHEWVIEGGWGYRSRAVAGRSRNRLVLVISRSEAVSMGSCSTSRRAPQA